MTFLRPILDALYPPRCLVCPTETDAPHGLCADCWRDTAFISGPTCATCGLPVLALGLTCEGCTRFPPGWDAGASALLYEGVGRRVVLALKHGDRLDTARPLAQWMLRAGGPLIARADLVIPVPMHWTRLTRRTYNQAAELSRRVAHAAGLDHAAGALTRPIRTPPLAGLTRRERIARMRGSIAVAPRWASALPGRSVLLIDDVLTTGATLAAATEALKEAGAARVAVLTLARTAREDDPALT